MNSEPAIFRGFSQAESEKIALHLERLMPYLDLKRTVVVGGLPIRYHLVSNGIAYPERPFNDLDMIIESEDVLNPAVSQDFQIAHYHQDKAGAYYFALVDPVSRTKVDIFDYSRPPAEIVWIDFVGLRLRIRTLESQLIQTIHDTQKVRSFIMVDPKQFTDARLMLQVADLDKANQFWIGTEGLEDAFAAAEESVREHPELLKEKPYRKPAPYDCPECVHTEKFPLTPLEEVYRTLGYIE